MRLPENEGQALSSFVCQPVTVDREDVAQEIELAKLMGVARPSARLIRLSLEAEANTSMSFSGDPGSMATPVTGSRPIASPEVLERLMEWVETQPVDIAAEVLRFLGGNVDDELALDHLMKYLGRRGVITDNSPKPRHQPSLAGLLFEYCRTPRTRQELYDYARAIGHTAKRPEASVRQFLRRYTRTGAIVQDGAADVFTTKELN